MNILVPTPKIRSSRFVKTMFGPIINLLAVLLLTYMSLSGKKTPIICLFSHYSFSGFNILFLHFLSHLTSRNLRNFEHNYKNSSTDSVYGVQIFLAKNNSEPGTEHSTWNISAPRKHTSAVRLVYDMKLVLPI
jgi:hypothetical protein